jgi:hypothetical protein
MTVIAHDPLGTDRIPAGPRLSMFDPMFIGIDLCRHRDYAERVGMRHFGRVMKPGFVRRWCLLASA